MEGAVVLGDLAVEAADARHPAAEVIAAAVAEATPAAEVGATLAADVTKSK